MEHLPPPSTKPSVSLRDYIRRDLAHAHGIDRETLAAMDAKPRNEWSSTHIQWGIYAEKAEIGALDWIAGNAPGAIAHLRQAGIYIFDPSTPEEPLPTTYPTGTPVKEISHFDRSTKVSFACTLHPEAGIWRSKEPAWSRWFSESAEQIACGCKLNEYTTTAPYTNRPETSRAVTG